MGWIKQDLKLSDRRWTCKNGHYLDRDLNAAKNILSEGLKIISAGTVDNTGEAKIRPEVQAQVLKPEARMGSSYHKISRTARSSSSVCFP